MNAIFFGDDPNVVCLLLLRNELALAVRDPFRVVCVPVPTCLWTFVFRLSRRNRR